MNAKSILDQMDRATFRDQPPTQTVKLWIIEQGGSTNWIAATPSLLSDSESARYTERVGELTRSHPNIDWAAAHARGSEPRALFKIIDGTG